MEPNHPWVIMWEFRVRPGSEARFEEVYGPAGEWAEFFRRGEGYLGTELYQDTKAAGRYLTLDFWVSEAAYQYFRRLHAADYQALDARSEALTEHETPLGSFLCYGGPALQA